MSETTIYELLITLNRKEYELYLRRKRELKLSSHKDVFLWYLHQDEQQRNKSKPGE